MSREESICCWADIFQNLQDTELKDTYSNQWTLQMDNDLDDLTSNLRQQGWKIYQSSSIGKFMCPSCTHKWNSARVSLIFHYRLNIGHEDGEVRLKIYRQKCRSCGNQKMLKASFEEENVKDVLIRLITRIKKNCYYEQIEIKRRTNGLERTKPHESSLCEACLKGKCNTDRDFN
ncbi:receptor-transporting protein 3-like [Bombina bombina]|uniref:receptor-transporting protein 3-like n=1 Tax=Bombina bombina TaxID=8345 RepID=UPI00235ADE8D|nr:receptor-transporting protein 3-like [Bombina bombina]